MSNLTSRERRFCRLVAAGESKAQAVRIAYNRKRGSAATVAVDGNRISKRPKVIAEIQRLRGEAEKDCLMTLHRRLEILGSIAENKLAKHTDRIRAVDVYSRISGDQAPERVDVSTPPGQPMEVREVLPVGMRMTVAQRLAAIKARRLANTAASATP